MFEMRNPPILVAVIGFFAMIAGLYWIYLGVRILGFNWFGVLGDLPRFEQAGIWGWLAIIAGVAWIVAAFGLWSLLKWAWMFAMIVAGLALLGAFIWFLEYPGTGVGFSAAIMPLLIILYLNSASVKSQFHDAPDEEL
jgi:cytochrome c oxidase subunit IV